MNDTESPYHQSASEIFYNLLEQKKIILHEIVLTEFFSIITDSRKMESPWSTSQARDYIIKRGDRQKRVNQRSHPFQLPG
jgi:predicted nucleic acid-binding protein